MKRKLIVPYAIVWSLIGIVVLLVLVAFPPVLQYIALPFLGLAGYLIGVTLS